VNRALFWVSFVDARLRPDHPESTGSRQIFKRQAGSGRGSTRNGDGLGTPGAVGSVTSLLPLNQLGAVAERASLPSKSALLRLTSTHTRPTFASSSLCFTHTSLLPDAFAHTRGGPQLHYYSRPRNTPAKPYSGTERAQPLAEMRVAFGAFSLTLRVISAAGRGGKKKWSRATKACLPHRVFPGRLRSKYYPGPTLLDLGDLTGSRTFRVVWP
jgi:hypothetical protein